LEWNEIVKEVEILRWELDDVLEDGGKRALSQAKAQIEAQMTERSPDQKKRKKKQSKPWKLIIEQTAPVVFRECEIKGYRFQVDLFCTIAQPDSLLPDLNESLVIRVWSGDERLRVRHGLDSEAIRQAVTQQGRRVLARFHFDRASPRQEGPKYHLQVGGNPSPDEHCWHPKELGVPRFVHHPMSLLLACEFVLANFFPATHDVLCREPSWMGALRKAQECFLAPYFDHIKRWNHDVSLLKYLWNTP
jgi:hypothetical protein